jgi:hypothetical protein
MRPKAEQGARANDLRCHVSCYRKFSRRKSTDRSTYCCTSRASEGRGSSLTLGKNADERDLSLCKKQAELQRSHVIPKFTHKRIKKEDGRLLRFMKGGHPEGDHVQDAFFEDMLCLACEARFQKWEEHAARMFAQKHVFDFPASPGRQLVKITGFDYAKMKLFLMSILWRMGVAKDSVFSSVKLGPHAERLRRLLLDSDPGVATDYGCAATVIHMDGERMPLTRPADGVRYKTQNLRMYRALVDGVLFAWLVGSEEHMRRFRSPELLLQPDGSWWSYSRDWQNVDFIRSELTKLAAT